MTSTRQTEKEKDMEVDRWRGEVDAENMDPNVHDVDDNRQHKVKEKRNTAAAGKADKAMVYIKASELQI